MICHIEQWSIENYIYLGFNTSKGKFHTRETVLDICSHAVVQQCLREFIAKGKYLDVHAAHWQSFLVCASWISLPKSPVCISLVCMTTLGVCLPSVEIPLLAELSTIEDSSQSYRSCVCHNLCYFPDDSWSYRANHAQVQQKHYSLQLLSRPILLALMPTCMNSFFFHTVTNWILCWIITLHASPSCNTSSIFIIFYRMDTL